MFANVWLAISWNPQSSVTSNPCITTQHGFTKTNQPTHHSLQTLTQPPKTYLLVSPKSNHALQSITAQYPESLLESMQSHRKISWVDNSAIQFCSYNTTLKIYHSERCRKSMCPVFSYLDPEFLPNNHGKKSTERLVTNSEEWSLSTWWLYPEDMSRSHRLGVFESLWVG